MKHSAESWHNAESDFEEKQDKLDKEEEVKKQAKDLVAELEVSDPELAKKITFKDPIGYRLSGMSKLDFAQSAAGEARAKLEDLKMQGHKEAEKLNKKYSKLLQAVRDFEKNELGMHQDDKEEENT